MDIRGEYRVMINLWFEKWTQGGSIGLALLWSKIKKLKFASSFASPEKKNYYFIFTLWLWSKKFINTPLTTTSRCIGQERNSKPSESGKHSSDCVFATAGRYVSKRHNCNRRMRRCGRSNHVICCKWEISYSQFSRVQRNKITDAYKKHRHNNASKQSNPK